MPEVLVFGGTADGRMLAQDLARYGLRVCLSVATEYGRQMVCPVENLRVIEGRLDSTEMAELARGMDCVVDATHPYAAEATRNIRDACVRADVDYFRLLRPSGEAAGCIYVQTTEQAVDWLAQRSGNILLTTGSKELGAYTRLDVKRLYPRVLPTVHVVEECTGLGIPAKNIICMHGPFDEDMNMALIRQVGAAYLVTKESGQHGGFSQKISAARQAGITAVVIGRPTQEQGYGLAELERVLVERFSLQLPERSMFPLFVDVAGKRVVVFGGGTVAARRIHTLMQFDCEVEVVSPQLCERAREALPGYVWRERKYRQEDCAAADMVLAATNDRTANAEIAAECAERGIPVSVADKKEESSFYFPAVIKSGDIVVGVCANGKDHKLAKNMAQELREVILQGKGEPK